MFLWGFPIKTKLSLILCESLLFYELCAENKPRIFPAQSS